MSLSLHLITASVGEVAVSLLHLQLMILPFAYLVIHTLFCIGLNEVLLNEPLDLYLLHAVLPQLVLHKARELLLLSDLEIFVKVVVAVLHFDLLHMQVEDFFVAHAIVTHIYALAEFGRNSGGVDEAETGLGDCIATRRIGAVALLSHPRVLFLAWLRVGIREMHIAVRLVCKRFV